MAARSFSVLRCLSVALLVAGCGSSDPAETCATTKQVCGTHQRCDDASGVAACVCEAGYSGAGCSTCAVGYQDNDGDGTCSADCASGALTCGSHESCEDATGTAVCACDEGYAGPDCSTCATGFQDNDDDGTCLPDCTSLTCKPLQICDDSAGPASCTCPVTQANKVYLFLAGAHLGNLGGRAGADAYAADNISPFLETSGDTTYAAIALVSLTGDAIVDFPTSACVPTGVPIYGISTSAKETLLANDWADLMDGTITTSLSTAFGYSDMFSFWTGSDGSGAANGHDCDGWTSDSSSSEGSKSQMNTTSNWLANSSGDETCDNGYDIVGLAYCTSNCP